MIIECFFKILFINFDTIMNHFLHIFIEIKKNLKKQLDYVVVMWIKYKIFDMIYTRWYDEEVCIHERLIVATVRCYCLRSSHRTANTFFFHSINVQAYGPLGIY